MGRRINDFRLIRDIADEISMHSVYGLSNATDYPPTLPIPGQQQENELWNNGTDILTPLVTGPGHVFTSLCAFWAIASGLLATNQRVERRQDIPVTHALSKYDQLLSLVDNLPASMTPDKFSMAHVIVFQ